MKLVTNAAMKAVDSVLHQVRSLGPYLAIELLLPGGSIVALLLWVYRHRVSNMQRAGSGGSATGQLSARPPRKVSLSARARSLSLVVRSKIARLFRLVQSEQRRTASWRWTCASSQSPIAVHSRCG
jgi:hypothetical protein